MYSSRSLSDKAWMFLCMFLCPTLFDSFKQIYVCMGVQGAEMKEAHRLCMYLSIYLSIYIHLFI